MTIAINVLLGIAAAVLLLGVIAEQDAKRHDKITIAFMAVLAVIVAVNTIM